MTKLRNLATCWASLPAPNHNMCLEWTQTSIIIIKTPIYWWFQWHSLYKCPIFLFHHHYLTLAFINLSFCEDVLEWLYSLNVSYHKNLPTSSEQKPVTQLQECSRKPLELDLLQLTFAKQFKHRQKSCRMLKMQDFLKTKTERKEAF